MNRVVIILVLFVFFTGYIFAQEKKVSDVKKLEPNLSGKTEEKKVEKKEESDRKDEKRVVDKKAEAVREETKGAKVDTKKDKREVEREKLMIQTRLKSVAKNISKDLERQKAGAIVRVAVSRFSNSGDLAKKKEVGTLVMGELMISLSKFNNIELIERDKLDKVLDEMKLVQLGFADEKTAAQVGKMLQAQVVVVGEVVEAADKFVINARVVDVEKAKVLYQEGFNTPIEGMIALSSESIVLRSKMDAVYRSLIIPGWGQFYNRDNLKGVLFTVGEVGLFGTAVVMHINGVRKEDQYNKTNCDNGGDDCAKFVVKLKEDGEGFYRLRNYFIYGGVGLWFLNVIDAYLSGKDFDSAVKVSENKVYRITPEGLILSIRF